MFKRIIALFLVLVTTFLMVPVASADYSSTVRGFWDKALLDAVHNTSDIPFIGTFVQGLVGMPPALINHPELGADAPLCTISSDGLHHCNSLTGCETGEDEDGLYAWAVCVHCGGRFKCYSVELGHVYEENTQALPATAYASDGSMRWYCSFDDLQNPKQLSVYPWRYYLGTRPFNWNAPFDSIEQNGLMYSRGTDNRSICVSYSGSSNVTFVGPRLTAYSFVVPISGTYTLMDFPASSCTVIGDSCGTVSGGYPYSNVGQSWHKNVGDSLSQSYQVAEPFKEDLYVNYISGKVLFPVYSVIPDVVPGEPSITEQYYDNSTRIGNMAIDFGVKNEDNSITNVTNNYIVNETNNTYVNPASGEEKVINNWIYDYGDRSYHLTLEGGDTTTVTYGDENVTINETTVNENGDTITNNYTIYYVVNGTTPDPGPTVVDKTPAGLSRVFLSYGNKITQHYGHDGHGGVDVIPTSGIADTVIAHSEGEVVAMQTGQENDTSATGNASYGNFVKIKHPNGMYTLYAHLANVAVNEGDHVYRGQPLGLMGNTGRSFGAHLHFEVRDDTDTRINPEPYLNADLPGLETEEAGWTWWKHAWTDFRLWLSGLSNPGDILLGPGTDTPGAEEDGGWSFADLLKAIIDGVWTFIKGVPGAIFGGLAGLIDGFVGIVDFFSVFDAGNPDSVFNILSYGGEDLWG